MFVTTHGAMDILLLGTYDDSDLGSSECSANRNTYGKFEGLSLGF